MIQRLIVLTILVVSIPTFANPDAGISTFPSIYSECPDAPKSTPMDGGSFVPQRRVERVNCMLTTCETYAQKLEQNQVASPQWEWWLIGIGGAFLAGAGTVLVYQQIQQIQRH